MLSFDVACNYLSSRDPSVCVYSNSEWKFLYRVATERTILKRITFTNTCFFNFLLLYFLLFFFFFSNPSVFQWLPCIKVSQHSFFLFLLLVSSSQKQIGEATCEWKNIWNFDVIVRISRKYISVTDPWRLQINNFSIKYRYCFVKIKHAIKYAIFLHSWRRRK